MIDADAVTAELGVGAAGAVIGPVGAVDPVEVGCTETTANWIEVNFKKTFKEYNLASYSLSVCCFHQFEMF